MPNEPLAKAIYASRFANAPPRSFTPWEELPPDAKEDWLRCAEAAEASLESRLAEAERERDNWKAHAISRGKRLRRTRDLFINIRDDIEDEGDRVYFGSSNHADQFKEEVAWLNDFSWQKVMGEPENWDLLGALEKQSARTASSEAATARLTAALEQAKEGLVTALKLKGGWREAIVELEDHCSEPVRLNNMLVAADQLDDWATCARATVAQIEAALKEIENAN